MIDANDLRPILFETAGIEVGGDGGLGACISVATASAKPRAASGGKGSDSEGGEEDGLCRQFKRSGGAIFDTRDDPEVDAGSLDWEPVPLSASCLDVDSEVLLARGKTKDDGLCDGDLESGLMFAFH